MNTDMRETNGQIHWHTSTPSTDKTITVAHANLVQGETLPLDQIGQIANAYAAQNVFTDYQQRRSANTLRRQTDDLALFARYLGEVKVQITALDLFSIPSAWSGITYGLVDGFVRWMLLQGYAIGSINIRLSTIKSYCKLVAKAGHISPSTCALIRLVAGYRHKEVRNVDRQREGTRVGVKKAEPVQISREQATLLKSQPDTPQGRRDTVLMCLLLDHGLRCGEVKGLIVEDVNLIDGTLTFYREKVYLVQTHRLTPDTWQAVSRYIQFDNPEGELLMGSRKGGFLCGVMSTRAITGRVCVLGARIGLLGLSAHDCRHYWATIATRAGTSVKALQDAGGWKSPAMPLRYVESSEIANEGVKLS